MVSRDARKRACQFKDALSRDDNRGVSDHIPAVEWKAALAFANIGLAGEAVCGSKWARKHRPTLLDMCVSLLNSQESVMGICLNKVGNMDDILDEQKVQAI